MAPKDVTPTRHTQVFFAKAANQRLVRHQIFEEVSSLGSVRRLTTGLTYEFDSHYLVVDDELRARDAAYFKKYADLLKEEGTDTRPAQEWLRDHPKLNGEHGFVEIPPVAPDSGPVLQAITAAAIGSDVERLVAIHAEEEAEWKRPDVLEAASEALRMLEERELVQEPAPAQ